MSVIVTSSRVNLSPDILLSIYNNIITRKDRHVFLILCHGTWYLLSDEHYKYITIKHDPTSIRIVHALQSAERRQRLVKGIEYIGWAPTSTRRDRRIEDPEIVYPKSLNMVLSSLSSFGNLKSLVIKFNFDFHVSTFLDETEGFFESDDEDEVKEKEAKIAWRYLMQRVWDAVSDAKTIRDLVINPLIPCMVSSWRNLSFRKWISNLSTLQIHFYGKFFPSDHTHHRNGHDSFRTGSCPGVQSFYKRLHLFFLSNLQGLRELELLASSQEPLGVTTDHCSSIVFDTSHMECLEKLVLKNMFISANLATFLLARRLTLKSVKMHNCHSAYLSDSYRDAGDYEEPEGYRISWNSLFKDILLHEFPRLAQFRITHSKRNPTPTFFNYSIFSDDEDCLGEVTGFHTIERDLTLHHELDTTTKPDTDSIEGSCSEFNLSHLNCGDEQDENDPALTDGHIIDTTPVEVCVVSGSILYPVEELSLYREIRSRAGMEC